MLSTTGYFFEESKLIGRWMIPQMSVFPSRPIAINTSGGRQPAARSAETSVRSNSMTSFRSAVRRSSETGGRSTRDHVSTKYFISDENVTVWSASASVSAVKPVPSKLIR
jgi:hypothetical protein